MSRVSSLHLDYEFSCHHEVLLISITTGFSGAVYRSAVKAYLSRILHAAAPLGILAQENRLQCLKVIDTVLLMVLGYSLYYGMASISHDAHSIIDN